MGPRLLFCYVVWIGCAAPAIKIDRVYYINLATSVRRRIEMERWLTKSNTSYVRVEAVSPPLRHSPDLRCETSRQESHRCRGIIGLRDSNFYIMDHLNTSGLTLVLEDDIELNISRLPELVRRVPDDWDVIRFYCKRYSNASRVVFRTRFSKRHLYRHCSGTHAVLWREGRISKLRRVWNHHPMIGIDCLLSTDELVAYCVQDIDVRFKHYRSSIPKWKIHFNSTARNPPGSQSAKKLPGIATNAAPMTQ